MTEERKALIDKFQKWLDTKPREQIIAAVCANIAEEYAEQLLIQRVSQQRELLRSYNKFINEECLLAGGVLSDFEIEKFEERNCGQRKSHETGPWKCGRFERYWLMAVVRFERLHCAVARFLIKKK